MPKAILTALCIIGAVLLPFLAYGLLGSVHNDAELRCGQISIAEGVSTATVGMHGTPPHWICYNDRGTHDMGFWPQP